MSTDRDVVDHIDALIAGQVAAGEPEPAVDVDEFIPCPNPWCEREWHGFPITDKMIEMLAFDTYDETYRPGDDDSEVDCPGSAFEGEYQPSAMALDRAEYREWVKKHE